MSDKPVYADFLRNLPEVDVPFEGVDARLLTGPDGQAVFFYLPEGIVVPPHSHCAQWGIVVEGRLELTIGGVTNTFTKGDRYEIGDGEEHSAVMLTDCWVIDVFADPNRYSAK